MKKYLAAAGASLALAGAGLYFSNQAGADVAKFDWGLSSVTVTTGTCHQESCTWRLSVDVPATGQFIGLAGPTTESGTPLTVAIPPICGVVQADLEHINAHGNWEVEIGHKQGFDTCVPPTTTTTTSTLPPSTTSTTTPVTTHPPVVSAPPTTQPATCSQGGFAGCSQTGAGPSEVPSTTPTTFPNPGQLPNIPPEQNGVTQGNG